jgi:hypothetical protein
LIRPPTKVEISEKTGVLLEQISPIQLTPGTTDNRQIPNKRSSIKDRQALNLFDRKNEPAEQKK